MEVGGVDVRIQAAASSGFVHDEVEGEADEVKVRCWDQREALPGEPRCVICGRYGEYICDETDDDICSLGCKKTLLDRVASSRLVTNRPLQKRLPATDDCFYVRDGEDESKSQTSMSKKIEMLRKRLDIQVKGDSVTSPILSFSSCDLPSKLLQNIESAGYELPTPVQMQAIPCAVAGKNLLVSADTGSGKTASYLIPIVSHVANLAREHLEDQRKPSAIVLAPTRELCMQVEEEAKLLGRGLPFKTALVIGGDAMAGQLYRINQGVELIVGTPGRLVDLLCKNDIDLGNVSIFVVDEVDCMLQRGFLDQVLQIFTSLSQPMILMYSATVPPEIEKTATKMAKNLVVINVGRPNKPNHALKQLAIWVESKRKKKKLFDILMSKHFRPPIIVFVASRTGADLLSEAINITTGIKALSIHGDKPMKERRDTVKSFLWGEFSVLVATGLLGRGIDMLSVRQVIVFDMPNSIKEYVHLIGRASRLGEEGNVIVFVNEEDRKILPELVDMLKSSGAALPRELANSRYNVHCSRSHKKRKYSG
ncbi:DEAD-box ATP-dependent RNA helicase 41-like protein [Drosera capensis]